VPALLSASLTRPLAYLEVRTTGPEPDQDRIIEIRMMKFTPEARRQHWVQPLAADFSVASTVAVGFPRLRKHASGPPSFAAISARLVRWLQNCDLCGLHLEDFTLPFLVAEFSRAGVPFSLDGRARIDVGQGDGPGLSSDLAILAQAAALAALLERNR
jgi:DNA polymerase-3 subunit epsilon